MNRTARIVRTMALPALVLALAITGLSTTNASAQQTAPPGTGGTTMVVPMDGGVMVTVHVPEGVPLSDVMEVSVEMRIMSDAGDSVATMRGFNRFRADDESSTLFNRTTDTGFDRD